MNIWAEDHAVQSHAATIDRRQSITYKYKHIFN